jgi:transposase
MVTDHQVRRLMKALAKGESMTKSADKAGMDVKTARRYRRLGRLPSQSRAAHDWRTRPDPFEGIWEWVRDQLAREPGLEAKTLFEALQRMHPGRFADGQLRTLQRRVRQWRGLEGPGQEVFFAQVHEPGVLSQSDFTHMTRLGVTIGGQRFAHLVYHFVLTYSNWEAWTICYSESFESLSEGLQNALWELGGVPSRHRTDRLTSAVSKTTCPEEFTRRYQGLLDHYGLAGEKTRAGKANENGDVEQRHHRFKRAVEQALLLRGSRDFACLEAYEAFLGVLTARLNAGRQQRLAEERRLLRPLPGRRLDDCTTLTPRVHSGSLIHVDRNAYSVHSRLIGRRVTVRLYAQRLEVWYGQRQVDELPRLRGRGKHRVNYRHVIEWLVRKPGAFAQYRYREDLFPSSRFRMAYDALRARGPASADRRYLQILHLAARESESGVQEALGQLLEAGEPLTSEAVAAIVYSDRAVTPIADVAVQAVDLSLYDGLLAGQEVRA